MKMLAIHNDKIFFEQDTFEEEVPDFYNWLAEERGMLGKISFLNKEYAESGEEDANILKNIYRLAISGLLEAELLAYCGKYKKFYFSEYAANELYKLECGMNICIFTFYPKELYEFLREMGIVDNVYGAEGELDGEGKICGLKDIKLKNEDKVKEKMDELDDLSEKFTFRLNKYGILELFIDQIIAEGLKKEDVVVLGNGTELPMHKLVGKVVNKLKDVF